MLVGDTSGSMSEIELETIGGSVADIFQQLNLKDLVWLQIDVKIHELVWVKNAQQLRQLLRTTKLYEVQGRGGTDMRRAWAWMKEANLPRRLHRHDRHADAVSSNMRPAKDVLWVATRPGKEAPAHAGRTVYARVDPH